MPTREELPKDLAGLARRNALRVHHETFRADAGQLVTVIDRVLAPAPVSFSDKIDAPAGDVPDGVIQQSSEAGKDDALHTIRLFVDAQRAADSITSEPAKVSALLNIAQAVDATDPRRAARLFRDAERVADSITTEPAKASALSKIAQATVRTDLDRAERIADSITDQMWKGWALSSIAQAVAATDPDRAENIAHSITYEPAKAAALLDTAKAHM
jgi:hypothetical protein